MDTDTISDSEFAREVEALRAQRRISVNRPVIDPDLPDLASAHGSASTTHDILNSQFAGNERVVLRDDGPRIAGRGSTESQPSRGDLSSSREQFTARRRGTDASSSPTSPKRANKDASPDRPLSADPAHLFWVPASMHPEISPADFRKFLSDHAARAVREARPSTSAPHSPVSPSSQSSAGEPPEMSLSDRVAALRHQTDTSAAANTSSDLISRSTSLTRRGSTLRRQYQPDKDFGDDDSRVLGASDRPVLTLEELQQLEQIAEETTSSHDAARVRNILRRNLSMDMGGSQESRSDSQSAVSDLDDGDAPIIVPLPGQILRRAARTKVRKASLSGEGRLGSRRRVGQSSIDAGSADGQRKMDFGDVALAVLERTPSNASRAEASSSDETETQSAVDDGERPTRALSDDQADDILDAYSRISLLSDSDTQRSSVTTLPESDRDLSSSSVASKAPSPPTTPTASTSRRDYFDATRHQQHQQLQLEQQQPVYHPQPGSQVLQPTREAFANARIVPVPSSSSPELSEAKLEQSADEMFWPSDASGRPSRTTPTPIQRVPSTPSFDKTSGQAQTTPGLPSKALPAAIPPQFTQQLQPADRYQQLSPGVVPPLGKAKDKEKKGGFGLSWFGLGKDEEEKSVKKKEKEKDKEKDKDSSESTNFLSNLFSKKKHHEDAAANAAMVSAQRAGLGGAQITAGSLLDRQAQGLSTMGPNRYPIHIERAVYRLSHIKLANPRRPLYEQVLISNLMFWYLSIINKNQQAQQAQRLQQQQQQQQQTDAQSKGGPASTPQASPRLQGPGQQPGVGGQNAQQSVAEPQGQGASAERGGAQGSNSPSTAYALMNGSMPGGKAGGVPGGAPEAAAKGLDVGHGLQPNGVVGPTYGAVDGGVVMDDVAGAQHAQSSTAHAQQNSSGRPAKAKRGHLTKANRAPPGARTAEMAIPAAGYGMQHRQISDDMALQRDVQQFQQHQKHVQAQAQAQAQQHHQQQPQNHTQSELGQAVDPRVMGSGGQASYQGDHLSPAVGSSGNPVPYGRRSPQPATQGAKIGVDHASAANSGSDRTSAARLTEAVGRNGSDAWSRDDADIYGGVVTDHDASVGDATTPSGSARLGSAFQTSSRGSSGSRIGSGSSKGPSTTAAEAAWLSAHAPLSGSQGATSPYGSTNVTASPLATPKAAAGPGSMSRSRSPGGSDRRSDPTHVSPQAQSADSWELSAGVTSRRDRSSDPVDRTRAESAGATLNSSSGGVGSGQGDYQLWTTSRDGSSTLEAKRSPQLSARRWQTATATSARRPTSPPQLPFGGVQRSTSLEDGIYQRTLDVSEKDRPPSAGAMSQRSANSNSSSGTNDSYMTAVPSGGSGSGGQSPGQSRSPSKGRNGSSSSAVVLEGRGSSSATQSSATPTPRSPPINAEGWTLHPSTGPVSSGSMVAASKSADRLPAKSASVPTPAAAPSPPATTLAALTLGGSPASLAMLEAAKSSRERRR